MDEIKQRLKEASEACITSYEAWRAKPNDHGLREKLQEAVHELRKVGARLEIELAVSDRKTQGADPIPIPSHRASRRQGAELEEVDDRNNRREGGGRDQGPRDQGHRKPVQIRRPEGEGPQPGNDAASEDDGRKKPLSLRRTGGDHE